MTKQEKRVLELCAARPSPTLRELADGIGNRYTGGVVKIIERLQKRGWLDAHRVVTTEGSRAL